MTVNSLPNKAVSVQEAKILTDAAPIMRNPSSIYSQFLAKTSAEISDFFEAGNQKFKKK
jgi:hypothetical protein